MRQTGCLYSNALVNHPPVAALRTYASLHALHSSLHSLHSLGRGLRGSSACCGTADIRIFTFITFITFIRSGPSWIRASSSTSRPTTRGRSEPCSDPSSPRSSSGLTAVKVRCWAVGVGGGGRDECSALSPCRRRTPGADIDCRCHQPRTQHANTRGPP